MPFRHRLTEIAQVLRKSPTLAESLVWRRLRGKQLAGLKFRRQQPLGRYVVDFVCFEKRLVIEIDGGQHCLDGDKDEERDAWLKENGFTVLRFWNTEVLHNLEGVLERILAQVSG